MSEDILFEAMGGIDGEYVLSAARRLGLLAPVGKKPRRALRRTLIGLAAAAALLVLGTLTAMAVSEPVRDALLGFFGVEYSEDAPYASPVGSAFSPQGTPERIGTEELGDGVTASYFVAPESDTVPRYGFFFGDEGVWVEDGGSFVQLETRRFDEVLTVQGEEVRLTFDYAVHGGVCALTWFDPGQLWLDWNPVSRFSSPEAVLLMRIVDAERYCPVLLDLRTGEYADVLGETGLSAYWSSDGWVAPDGSGALIRMEDACYDWYDARRGELIDLDACSGESVDSCILTDSDIICLGHSGQGSERSVHVWSIDPDTLERRNILDATPAQDITLCTAGLFSTPGSSLALLKDGSGACAALDLVTGERREIPGLTLPDAPQTYVLTSASPDGKMLALVTVSPGEHYGNITVIDSETGRFYSVERKSEYDINENRCYWYGEDAFAVCGYEFEGEGENRQRGASVCFVYEFGE